MNKKSILGILIIIILFIVAYIGHIYSINVGNKTFSQFNSSEINGVITYIGIKYRGAAFRIEKNPIMQVFYPITDKRLNGGHIFDNFAEIGDTIIKHAYSDTLYLIKGNKMYKYEFAIPK